MSNCFLQSEIGRHTREDSFFHVIPAPFEATVSYGGGTSQGPAAIINASQQLELFDGTSVPAECGIFTAPLLSCTTDVKAVINTIAEDVGMSLHNGACPILLGGEHTISCGAFRAVQEMKKPAGIIQFDAHADLRDMYEGTAYSHACVMRRACDMGLPVFQVATRSLSPEEHLFRQERGIAFHDAGENYDMVVLPDYLPKDIYITVDIDAFDISVMPATGTPEPGGIGWYQFFSVLHTIAAQKNILGFDLVEYAPIAQMHAYDYFCARLLYNIMGVIQRSRGK